MTKKVTPDLGPREVAPEEAAAIVVAAGRATPTWHWERVEGDPRRRYDRQAWGRIEIGKLAFQVWLVGAGNLWEMHWKPDSPTRAILNAHEGRAGVFRKVVVCMRDMIGEFLTNGHPDRLRMICATPTHAKFYTELLPASAGEAHAFQLMTFEQKSGEIVINGVQFKRDTERRRPHGFDPRYFDIGERRIPAEFAAPEPVSSLAM